jgi:hypothetical protein
MGVLGIAMLVAFLWVLPARAALLTDVIDAADVNDDPFDFVLQVDFIQEHEWAMITRERNTLSTVAPRMLNQNEYQYRHVKSRVDIGGRLGLYKDLEFHFILPIHVEERYLGKMSSHWRDKYWGGGYDTETAYEPGRPSLMTDRVIGFAGWDAIHRGFGDMTMGFTYSPVNQTRDKWWPSWIITFDMQLPTGKEQSPYMDPAASSSLKGVADDIGVGKKLLRFVFKTAISMRVGKAEPYFGMNYIAPVAVGTYIKDPRHEGGFLLGTEAIAYEMWRENENEPLWKVAFDFRMSATMYGRGQDFNAITDPMAWRRDRDNTSSQTYWPTDPRANDAANPNMFYFFNGQAPEYALPIEDRYTYVEGKVGFYSILYHYLLIKIDASVGHRTEHYLSLPDGLDFNTLRPSDISGYNTQVNEVGARVRLAESLVVTYTVTLGLTY